MELGVSEVTKDHYIVTMTDITEIEKSFNRKIEMLSSQINSKEKIKFCLMLERLQVELDKLSNDGLQVRFKGGAVEYSADDSVQTLFKKAVSAL